jgi:hypothetical protein
MAKLALTIWRQHFLKPNLISNLPESGLRPFHLQSIEARRFLRVYALITGKTVQTADWSDGEHCSWGDEEGDAVYRLDGFVHDTTPGEQPLAIEYYGCRFHG